METPEAEHTTPAFSLFELGDFDFADGTVLPDAKLAYATYGELNETRDNVVVFPTWFAGTHADSEWIIGPDNGLDTSRYFVVVPHLFGNGVSSSPSNTPPPYDRSRFPKHTIQDNVRAQHRLVTELFDVRRIELVIGGSMGAMQAYQWALSHSDLVRRIMPCCGAARTSPHCYVFTRGVEAALLTDASWNEGDYIEPPTAGLRAMARVWAGWGLSQRWYWTGQYRTLGYNTVDDFLTGFWEELFLTMDANNLLNQLWTWQNTDLSATPGFDGSLPRALSAIKAKAFVAPGERDLYFPQEDSAWEVAQLPDAELRIIPGLWGHFSDLGLDEACSDFIRATVNELLAT
jgi:homoserine O-acetyltransferase